MVTRRAALVTATAWLIAAGATASGQTGSTEAGQPSRLDIGRAATPADIEAWDIDVMPDGHGLPDGQGTVAEGEAVYLELCAACHGPEGEGATAAPLVGAETESTPPFGPRYEAWRSGGPDVPFTVGNYWPYAPTLFDYINRAMPPSAPGSLDADQVYALVAWLLAKNGIVADDAVLGAGTLAAVDMPARGVFVPAER